MEIPIRFLQYDRALRATLPDESGTDAHASTTVTFGKARSMSFVPRRGPAELYPPGEFQPLFDIDVGATTVTVYERVAAPQILCPVWGLANGTVATFIDEPVHGLDDVRTLVDAARITERPDTVPSVRVVPPLARGDYKDPANRDNVMFSPSADRRELWPVVELTELAYSGSPVSGVDAQGDWVSAWQTSALGVIVRCSGPRENENEIRELATAVSNSLSDDRRG